MGKSTHILNCTVPHVLRVGGAGAHALGGHSVTADRVPNNWYPQNPPAATAGTPQNSDCATLLDNLSKLVALFTVQQSVFLANVYRTVQPGVVAGGTFSVYNPATSANVTSGAATSLFDQNVNISEAVAVDVVNKNPSLTVDLALRLAVKTAKQIDSQSAALYTALTVASVGSSGTTPTAANLATQINALPNTGEPILGFFTPATVAAYFSANPSQTVQNGNSSLIAPTGANKLIRMLASEAIVASTGNRNIVMTPSALAFASADQGASLGSAPVINPAGTQIVRVSNFFDVEVGNQPQLSLQLVIGNTGSGVQSVYVNYLGAAIALNPGNGATVLS